jgi:hypothetical protein
MARARCLEAHDRRCGLESARMRVLHLQAADLQRVAAFNVLVFHARDAAYRVLEEQREGAVVRVRACARAIFARQQRGLNLWVREQAQIVEPCAQA